VRVYCGRRSNTVGAGRISFPIGFGRIIMSTASDPQLPQRPWRSRSVGTRQSTHHQCRSTHVCPRSTFVFDMAPLWAKASGRSIGAKSLFWRQNRGTKVLKPGRHPPPYSRCRPLVVKPFKAVWRFAQLYGAFSDFPSNASAWSAPSGVSSCLKYTKTSPRPTRCFVLFAMASRALVE